MAELTHQQVSEYWERGYLLVPEVFDAVEVRNLKAECERLASAGGLMPSGSSVLSTSSSSTFSVIKSTE